MTDDKGRRHFLRCGLTAFAALAVSPAHAQTAAKATQEQAHYEDHVDTQTCAECSLYEPPADCKMVQGPVSEMGTCLYFTPAGN